MKITPGHPERGVGSACAFDRAEGAGVQTTVAVEPDARVVAEIDLGGTGEPLRAFMIERDGGGACVTRSAEARFGKSPMRRVFGLFMEGRLVPVWKQGR